MVVRHPQPRRPSFYNSICAPTVTGLYSDPRTIRPRPAHYDHDATTRCAAAAANNDNGNDVQYVPIPIIGGPFTRDRGPTTRTTRSVAVPRVRSPSPTLAKVSYSPGLRNGILQAAAAAAASTTAAETAALTTEAEAETTAETAAAASETETAAEKEETEIAATAAAAMVGAEVDDPWENPWRSEADTGGWNYLDALHWAC